jgi:hypothetical protein
MIENAPQPGERPHERSTLMTGSETLAIAFAILLTILGAALLLATAFWVHEDATRRGMKHPGLLAIMTGLSFPFPVLVYLVMTRELDRRTALEA